VKDYHINISYSEEDGAYIASRVQILSFDLCSASTRDVIRLIVE